MDNLVRDMAPDARESAKHYLFCNDIPQLFESLTAGLLHHRPADPVAFVQDCLDAVRPPPGVTTRPDVRWATFIDWKPPPDSRTMSRMIGGPEAPSPRHPRSKPGVQLASSNSTKLTGGGPALAHGISSGTVSGHTTPRDGLSSKEEGENRTGGPGTDREGTSPGSPQIFTPATPQAGGNPSVPSDDSRQTVLAPPPIAMDDISLDQELEFDPTNFEPPTM